MKIQTTYHKQTAAALLKTARVEVMSAGNAEIIITLPDHRNVQAVLAERPDGWGGTTPDVLMLSNVDGTVCCLYTTPASLATLRSLLKQQDARQVQATK